MRVDPVRKLKKEPFDLKGLCRKAAIIIAFISTYFFFFKILFF